MATKKDYDIAIIGAGCFGSACAYHLTKLCNKRICLIGPNEPQGPRSESKNTVFASHYDTGRLTYPSGINPTSPILNQRSINRYRQIESESDIPFYNPVGFMVVGTPDCAFITANQKSIHRFNIKAEILNSEQITEKFPYLTVPKNFIGIYQPENAGYIDIRRCVKAQIQVATSRSCDHITETVESIVENSDGKLKIHTDAGHDITAAKVILATGAFSLCKDLMTKLDRKLQIKIRRETTIKLQVNSQGLQEMRNMPSIIYIDKVEPRNNCYILPPIKYDDDDVYYLKIGHGIYYSKIINSDELVPWFHGTGDPEAQASLLSILKKLMPNDYFTSMKYDSCAITCTPHGYPMIGKASNDIHILIGGNGGCAKSCNEIGHIGALNALNDEWQYDIPSSTFEICYANKESAV